MAITFGKRLQELRNSKKMTQAELGKILKVSASTIGMYETDKRQPNFEIEEARAFELVVAGCIVCCKRKSFDVPLECIGCTSCIITLIICNTIFVILLHVQLDPESVLVAYGFIHRDIYITMISMRIFFYCVILF